MLIWTPQSPLNSAPGMLTGRFFSYQTVDGKNKNNVGTVKNEVFYNFREKKTNTRETSYAKLYGNVTYENFMKTKAK